MRVQHIQQDDAHLFVTEDQIEAEYDRVLAIVKQFYEIFDMSYHFYLGTRPDSFLATAVPRSADSIRPCRDAAVRSMRHASVSNPD